MRRIFSFKVSNERKKVKGRDGRRRAAARQGREGRVREGKAREWPRRKEKGREGREGKPR